MNIENVKPVAVECLDKARSLLFTPRAMREIKEAYKASPLAWGPVEWKAVITDVLEGDDRSIVLIAALLRHEDSSITADAVLDMIHSSAQMVELMPAIQRAYAHYLGKTDAEYDEILATEKKKAELAQKQLPADAEAEAEAPLANAQT